MYERPTVDDANLTRTLDVTAGNPYYAMQDALAVPTTSVKPQGWTTSGAWSLFLSADRMYASKQAPFLITETNAGAIGGPSINFPAFDGQWRQPHGRSLPGRGDDRVLALAHQPLRYRDVLGRHPPHDQQPGRVRRVEDWAPTSEGRLEGGGLARRAGRTAVLSPIQMGPGVQACFCVRAGKTFVSSLADMDQRSYHRIFEAFYRGTFDARSGRIIHDNQIIDPAATLDPDRVAAELPTLIVPGLLVADDKLLLWLRDYAGAGGHLVLGPRSAYDGEVRAGPQPRSSPPTWPTLPGCATRSSPT